MFPRYNADIRTILSKDQRFRTVGDCYADGPVMRIRVSVMKNLDYELLTAIHEMIERRLCEKAGITEQAIDAWRLLHEDEDEPGNRSDCPYRQQHVVAEAIEYAIAEKLGVDWVEYGMAAEDAIDVKVATGLRKPKPPKRDKKPSRSAVSYQIKRILEEQET